jgi:UDP-4-keto-D-QuiNAc 4-reductase
MIKSAFVTGASGFVGSTLSARLLQSGWQVRTSPLRLLSEPAQWQAAFASVRCVVHLAAHVHKMKMDSHGESIYTQINAEGSRFVAEQAVRAGVERVVFLSSVKVNGEGGKASYQADDPPNPSDAYGRSKLAAEEAIREVCESGGVQYVVIRPPLVYGPGVKANFRSMMRWVDRGLPLPLGSVRNRRSLVGVSNLVSFIETCMLHPRATSNTWMIADGESVSTPQILRTIARHMNRNLMMYRFPPSRLSSLGAIFGLRSQIARLCDSLIVDDAPAREELGWRPVLSFDEEIARTVAAYRNEKAA